MVGLWGVARRSLLDRMCEMPMRGIRRCVARRPEGRPFPRSCWPVLRQALWRLSKTPRPRIAPFDPEGFGLVCSSLKLNTTTSRWASISSRARLADKAIWERYLPYCSQSSCGRRPRGRDQLTRPVHRLTASMSMRRAGGSHYGAASRCAASPGRSSSWGPACSAPGTDRQAKSTPSGFLLFLKSSTPHPPPQCDRQTGRGPMA